MPPHGASADPSTPPKVLGADSCATSGCHGGAGPNRGAYHIWKDKDPHARASATLTNGQSAAMARKAGIGNAADSASCTVCHAPMRNVEPSLLAPSALVQEVGRDFSCANCHGPAEDWLLSHTRPDYPRAALEKLGMRPLGSAYERANSCVACHQNLPDGLVKANHPPLIFELDGLLIEQPRHWREDPDFSHAKTWLVGQAVALREATAQAARQPGEARTAEIEAIKELLAASGTGWSDGEDPVRTADEFAKRVSIAPLDTAQTRAVLDKLMRHRGPFEAGAFAIIDEAWRMRTVGHYAERVTLAIDRLNQSLLASGQRAAFSEEALDELFKAALPPKSFDRDAADHFASMLDGLLETGPQAMEP